MRTLSTAVLFVVGLLLLAEVKAYPCDQYTPDTMPRPGSHPDSYKQGLNETFCPVGETFVPSACECMKKPTLPPMIQPQQPQNQQYPPQPQQPAANQMNMVYPQGQPVPMQTNAFAQQPQMTGYPQMQQMPQMQMGMVPAMYPQMQAQPQMTPQQQMYLQALQQQQAALMYGQTQPNFAAAWGQAPQQSQPAPPANAAPGMAAMPNNLITFGAVQGNDLARDLILAQSLARGITPAGPASQQAPGQPAAPGMDPSLLSWAAMSGNPMASSMMSMNVLRNPQLAPLAAIYGLDQATELAATQSLVSGGMRNPALGMLSTTFLDLPETAPLMFAAQGASGAGVTPPSASGAGAAGATSSSTNNAGSSGGNRGGGGFDPLMFSLFMNM